VLVDLQARASLALAIDSNARSFVRFPVVSRSPSLRRGVDFLSREIVLHRVATRWLEYASDGLAQHLGRTTDATQTSPMATRTLERDLAPVLSAARRWMDVCLVQDGSVCSSRQLWTAPLLREIRRAFVDHPDEGKEDFITKLKRQLKGASPDSLKLMSEMLWVLLLFPSNVKKQTKRGHIREIWQLSGESFPASSALFEDAVLNGIGSGGPGFNNHRWRELSFLISLSESLKKTTSQHRGIILSNYDAFLEWMDEVKQDGNRQFRHMLRYFAFPDRVERMSSNGDRQRILAAFDIAAEKETRQWSDRELDDALLQLRGVHERQYPNHLLDFYHPPLVGAWKPDDTSELISTNEKHTKAVPSGSAVGENQVANPVNLILFGPPGTGKTHWLRQKMSAYVNKASANAGGDSNSRCRLVTFHPSFSYEDFVRGIRPVANRDSGTATFALVDGVFKRMCDEARANPKERYALFIDEINRANIAKVFGELITLIELDKRVTYDAGGRALSGMTLSLAGGSTMDGEEVQFGVPSNLDIFGTMNTVDRSIALLDVALRRRFEFKEMEPEYQHVDRYIGSIHLGSLLQYINDRLEYLLDRDHRIGHAYLMKAKSLADLRGVFRLQIIPLLQEFFFDDLARVALVLANRFGAPPLIAGSSLSPSDLFPSKSLEGAHSTRSNYLVTADSTWTEESFKGIYQQVLPPDASERAS
jgi:5-methylcytosine-specific restriction enzyme B